jgi:hypothetical protein
MTAMQEMGLLQEGFAEPPAGSRDRWFEGILTFHAIYAACACLLLSHRQFLAFLDSSLQAPGRMV